MLNFNAFENYNSQDKILISNHKRALFEILVGICIINPDFLTKILEGGYKHRYTLDNKSFLLDVKNILLNNNTKFKLGKYVPDLDEYTKDDEISKIKYVFTDDVEFDIEKNWNKLVNADKLAKSIREELNIIDLDKIYWTGLDLLSEGSENLVVKTENEFYKICIKNIFNTTITKSADVLLSDLFNKEIDLYSEEYMDNWDIISNKYINLVYKYSTIEHQKLILEWLHVKDIKDIDYKEYNNIRHSGEFTQKLGKHVIEFEKNIIYLKNLIKEIYNTIDNEEFKKEWEDVKSEFLNSRIIEHMFITELKEIGNDSLYYNIDGETYKSTSGQFKTCIANLILNKILATEGDIYFFSENGKKHTYIPSDKSIIEDDNIIVLYKYHTNLEEYKIFTLDIFVGKNEEGIIKKMFNGVIEIDWFNEMQNKLKSKIKFDYTM